MAARERAPARFQERDVAKPAAVRLPAVLEAHRRGQTLLDRVEPAYVSLDLERFDREAPRLEIGAHPGLVVGKPRHLAGLLPLVDVKRDHREAGAAYQGLGRTLDDGVRGAEVGGDQVGAPGLVRIGLDIALVEFD